MNSNYVKKSEATNYVEPAIEVIEINQEGSILCTSGTGEGVDWQDGEF